MANEIVKVIVGNMIAMIAVLLIIYLGLPLLYVSALSFVLFLTDFFLSLILVVELNKWE